MVEDTVSRSFKQMKDAAEQGVPLKFYIDSGDEFVDMRDVMRENQYDLTRFYRTYNYSHEDVVFLYVNSSDEPEEPMVTRIDAFLNKIGKTYIYSIDNLRRQWPNMTARIAPKMERFKLLDEFFNPYRGDELVVPYTNKTIKTAKIEHASGMTLEGATLYHLLEVTERMVYVRFGELIKVHKDRTDVNLSYKVKPDHLYAIYVTDEGDPVEVDVDTVNDTIEYVDVDIGLLSRIFGSGFLFSNEQSSRVEGSFTTQIQNFDDFTFYLFTSGFVQHTPRLVLSNNQLVIERDEDTMTSIKYPIIYMNDFSSPRSLSKSTNKYYLRNLNRDNLVYAMSFQLVNIGVNNYRVNYEIKRQLNATYALQFLKTYFNYYEQHAVRDGVLRGKTLVEAWYGEGNPYHSDDKIKAIPSKIANLKHKSQTGDNMFEPETYARNMCECRNQPIIIDKEDRQYWDGYSETESNNKPILFPPVKGDAPNNSKYYVCPTLNKPVMVLKSNKGKNNKKYPYLPCCAETMPAAPITEENYFQDEGRGPTKTTRQAKSSTPLKQISPNLQRFFSQFGQDFFIYSSKSNTGNSFVGCLLQTHRPRLPGRERLDRFINEFQMTIEDTTQDRFINEFRFRCLDMGVHPCTAKQELYDYSIDGITKLIQNGDSSLAYRFFEHLFMVNIVILYVEMDQVYVKRPRYRRFHIRNPIPELPTLFLHYDKERYSVIGRDNGQHLFFNYDIRPLLQPYYKTETSPMVTYQNPYQGIIWEKIFKIFEITGQRIDEDGKTYAINLNIDDTNVSVYVPPSVPLNIFESPDVGVTSSATVARFFEGGHTGCGGYWFEINRQEEVFIPCSDVSSRGRVCPHYVCDRTPAQDNYRLHVNRMGNAKILTEVMEWAWKLSKKSVDEFFRAYTLKVQKVELFNTYMDFGVSAMFPNTTILDFLHWLCRQNATFQVVIYNNRFNLYEGLHRNLYLHMKHLERTADHLVKEFSITAIRNRQNKEHTMEFTNATEFNQWRYQDQTLHLLERLEDRPIYVYRNPARDLFLVKHTDTTQQAVEFTNRFTGKAETAYTLYDPDMQVLKGNGRVAVIRYDTGFSTLIPLLKRN